jgi:hypothetical protein
MLRIEHTAFSRDALAQGAIYAAVWLSKQKTPKVYNMADVLSLTQSFFFFFFFYRENIQNSMLEEE